MKQLSPPSAAEFAFRLDPHSGVPVYRQLIDQVLAAIATAALLPGNQLPTVRQVAVDLAINPNTVMRAYREMEIRGILDTQQGAGSFIAEQQFAAAPEERNRQLAQLAHDFVARAASLGFTLPELLTHLRALEHDSDSRRNP